MFSTLDIGATGLQAQRVRMDTVAANVLHMNTTRNASGEKIPYQRRLTILQAGSPTDPRKPGVHVAKIELDRAPPIRRFDPGHEDAGPDGYVAFPNIDLAVEMVNMIEASRAYEANITMMETTKQMINATLRLLA